MIHELKHRVIDALKYKTVAGMTIGQLSDTVQIPVSKLKPILENLEQQKVAERVVGFRMINYWRLSHEWLVMHR